jgi:hypothetical protein
VDGMGVDAADGVGKEGEQSLRHFGSLEPDIIYCDKDSLQRWRSLHLTNAIADIFVSDFDRCLKFYTIV